MGTSLLFILNTRMINKMNKNDIKKLNELYEYIEANERYIDFSVRHELYRKISKLKKGND